MTEQAKPCYDGGVCANEKLVERLNQEIARLSLANGVLRQENRMLKAEQAAELPSVYYAVYQERQRQDVKWGEQNISPYHLYSILAEEFGEVGRALNEGEPADYRKELVQVAAVAVKMVQRYDVYGWHNEDAPSKVTDNGHGGA